MKYLIYASPFVGLFLILGTGPATVAQTYQDPPSLVKIPCSHARENHSSWVEKLSSPQLNCKLTQLRQIYWGGFYDSTFYFMTVTSGSKLTRSPADSAGLHTSQEHGHETHGHPQMCASISLHWPGRGNGPGPLSLLLPFIFTHRAFS